MDFLSHILWANLLFRKREWRWQGIAFAILPDFPIVLVMPLYILGYNVDAMRQLWSIDFATHSLLVIGILFVIASLYLRRYYYPLLFGSTLHVFMDLITHKGSHAGYPPGTAIFYPFTEFRIDGIINYEKDLWFLGLNFGALILIYSYIYLKRGKKTKDV
jgi:LexA-binding, inner membrane-associated putative hydrolase